MKQLSKDYRLVLFCSLFGLAAALFLIQLPQLALTKAFWQYSSYLCAALIGAAIIRLYVLSRKIGTDRKQ